jgi:hypothetical protein
MLVRQSVLRRCGDVVGWIEVLRKVTWGDDPDTSRGHGYILPVVWRSFTASQSSYP